MNHELDILMKAGKGAIAGAIWGYFGWRNLGRPKGEKFSGPKLLRAVASGAVAGAVGGALGMEVDVADQWVHSQLAELGLLAAASAALDQGSVRAWRELLKLYARIRKWLEER